MANKGITTKVRMGDGARASRRNLADGESGAEARAVSRDAGLSRRTKPTRSGQRARDGHAEASMTEPPMTKEISNLSWPGSLRIKRDAPAAASLRPIFPKNVIRRPLEVGLCVCGC